MGIVAECKVCFHHCKLKEGQVGFCLARRCVGGQVVAENYGRITSLALDPVEKKPLRRFYPGSRFLSLGSYGCNLRCPFCQNYELSYTEEAAALAETANTMSPQEIVDLAKSCRSQGNMGIAYTYNEPLVGYEFVRDTAILAKKIKLMNILVTNGTAEPEIEEELLPYMDAMNVDLKAFTDRFYRDFVGGNRQKVMDFIYRAAGECHLEVTTVIIPGENDSEKEMDELSSFLAQVGREKDCDIPLHITRFFPRFKLKDRSATSLNTIDVLFDAAKKNLRYVYVGNLYQWEGLKNEKRNEDY